MGELVAMLGLSKTWVVRLAREPDFPAPCARLGVGQLWRYEDIAAWAKRTGRTVHRIPVR